MNDDVREEDGHAPVAAEAPLPLPLEFEAHYLTNQEAFHEYALFILRTNERAEKAVHRCFLEILRHWDALLADPNLQEQTWQIMRRVIIGELIGGLREELLARESDTELNATLARLPARQFDVIVLRHIGEYDTKHIAWYMGLTPSTVTHHLRKAQERLAPVYQRTTRPINKEYTR
ncbi:RNA polymerase sigma factor [Streptomyces nigrescens]|uniref:RNA polymerase sigma factor n=1 Tax=Streptomyces nigrescens TaxID=1920 RepID=UPI00224E2257|nr:sigma-70 family RNA polymerase sigma factor [Streptomyces libani]MCX5449885.1 sigma-70 family RNA polymerase sigma factor [Streptomyces libani]